MPTDQITSRGWKYARADADLQVAARAGVLHAIVVNPGAAGGTVTIYDNTAESGTAIVTLTVGTTAQIFEPINLVLDAAFATGLYIGFDATFNGSVTVTYS